MTMSNQPRKIHRQLLLKLIHKNKQSYYHREVASSTLIKKTTHKLTFIRNIRKPQII